MDNGDVGSPGQSVLRAVEEALNLSQGSVTLHHHLMVEDTVMEIPLNGEIVTLMLVLSLVKKHTGCPKKNSHVGSRPI